MKKDNIEEGVKRIAILIWLVWVAYWLFLHLGYPDYGSWNCENYIYLTSAEHPIYLTNPMKAFHSYERTSWVGFWIAQGCLFYSFDAGLYFLGELLLNIIVFKFIVVPAIIYFPVVFIWTGFTTKFDDKNK
mgnify:FL=1